MKRYEKFADDIAELIRSGMLSDRQRAVAHYSRFVSLWDRADPELQPKVREVRERLARLERAD